MNRAFQLAALVLSVALLATPASALSVCWIGSENAKGDCGAECPMAAEMTAHHAADTVQAAAGGASCCDLSSGKPVPTRQPLVPTSSALAAVNLPQSSGVFAAVIVPANTFARDAAPIQTTASPQAVLCTFLI